MDLEDVLIIGAAIFGVYWIVNQSMPSSGGGILATVTDAAVKAIAEAIAVAEGFYVSGSIPQRANNPGDLMAGDVPAGVATNGTLGAGIVVFVSLQDGWNALFNKISNMLTGNSHVYSPDMTISQVAQKYTATQPADWANNVSESLGVSPDTTLSDAAALHG